MESSSCPPSMESLKKMCEACGQRVVLRTMYAKPLAGRYHRCVKSIQNLDIRAIGCGLHNLTLYFGGREAKLLVEGGAEVRWTAEADLKRYFGHGTGILLKQRVSTLQAHISDEFGRCEVCETHELALKLAATESNKAGKFLNAKVLIPHLCFYRFHDPP